MRSGCCFAILALAAAAPLCGQSTLTCSSDDMHRHYCSADTRGGVRLLRQRSQSACREGYSWGADRRGIWVDHGCRADFELGGGYRGRGDGGPGYSGGVVNLTCSSDDMRRHYCAADTRGGVRLLRQRSEAACQEGYSWGADRRGIWVDHGCRADFQLGGGGFGGWHRGREREEREERGDSGYGPASVVACSSDDMHRHFCAADTRGGVRLLRQRSEAACREGYSWGADRRGIWVDHGCRADFSVGR